jgi:cytochrome c biogenesis protein CcmG, thiol:disulfide interchange protein DsbE
MNSKRLIILSSVFIIAFLLLFTLFKGSPKRVVGVDLQAPDLDVKDDISGRKLRSGDLKNKVIFVNFWASWCPPCKEEMPSVEALFKDLAGNDKFQMITILYKDSLQDGRAYMKQNGYTFPVYSDNNGITAENFGVTGVPETYIIDKKGILKKRVIGPAEWNSPEAKTFINSLLNE